MSSARRRELIPKLKSAAPDDVALSRCAWIARTSWPVPGHLIPGGPSRPAGYPCHPGTSRTSWDVQAVPAGTAVPGHLIPGGPDCPGATLSSQDISAIRGRPGRPGRGYGRAGTSLTSWDRDISAVPGTSRLSWEDPGVPGHLIP